jgi:hypothetical protein
VPAATAEGISSEHLGETAGRIELVTEFFDRNEDLLVGKTVYASSGGQIGVTGRTRGVMKTDKLPPSCPYTVRIVEQHMRDVVTTFG